MKKILIQLFLIVSVFHCLIGVLSPVFAQTIGNGDANNDGKVDYKDIQFILQSYSQSKGIPTDQYGDGVINMLDVSVPILKLSQPTATLVPSSSPTSTPIPILSPTPIPQAVRMIFSTYLGGNNFGSARDVTIDSVGNVYVAGGASSSNFPIVPSTIDHSVSGTCLSPGSGGNMDIFVTKYSPTGTLLWSTLLGSPCYDRAYAIEVDAQQNVYLGGRAGEGFPVSSGVVQPTFAGGPTGGAYGEQDGFLAKLSPDGKNVLWSTYWGTPGWDVVRDFTIDSNGNVYPVLTDSNMEFTPPNIVGVINSTGFKTSHSGSSNYDGVIAKISPDAKILLYASYVGGSANDSIGPSIRVDGNGYIYTVGGTSSSDALNICTSTIKPSPVQSTFAGGTNDQLLIKVDPSKTKCSSLLYQTYFGSSGNEGSETHTLAVDGSQNAYIAWSTDSTSYPSANGYASSPGFRKTSNGQYDGFIARINTLSGLVSAGTFVGGASGDGIQGVALDGSGNVYVGGETHSTNFPVTANAFQKTIGSTTDQDAYVVKMPPDLSGIMYATYLGGSVIDVQRSMWVDSSGTIVSVGETNSPNYPKLNATGAYGGTTGDAYVTKFK